LSNSSDKVHEANYGACMCASRADLLAIGGADEHLDYLGYICGPHEMTFRLVNYGRREHWLEHERIYHVWHPGQAGGHDYGGPHDGRNVSLRTLELRQNVRVEPWVENPAVAALRADGRLSKDQILAVLANRDHRAWEHAEDHLAMLDPVELLEQNYRGYNVIRDKTLYIGLHQGEGAYTREKVLDRVYRRCYCGGSPEDVKAAIHDGSGSPLHLRNVDRAVLASLANLESPTAGQSSVALGDVKRTADTSQAPAPRSGTGSPRPDDDRASHDTGDALVPPGPADPSPASVDPRTVVRSELLNQLGWAHYWKALYGDALRRFDMAVRLDAHNRRALAGRAWTLMQQGCLDRALDDFDRLIADLPPDARAARLEAFRGRAWTHCRRGEFQHAIDDFNRALAETVPAERSDRSDILRGRSRALVRQGRTREATDDFRASKGVSDPRARRDLGTCAVVLHGYAATVTYALTQIWRRTRTLRGRSV
jgi:tetratricopeptide (TPR) repeat protein